MPSFMSNFTSLAPSYFSSFFPPQVGKTKFNDDSAYSEYLYYAGRYGFSFSYRFLAYFESPWLENTLQFSNSGLQKRLSLHAFSVNVPGKYFSTLERDIGGPKRRIPYTTTFDDDLTMQFYCSAGMAEYEFMQKWMDEIINPVTRYVSYYDDFAKDTNITLLFIPNKLRTIEDIMGAFSSKKLKGIRFTEVYPKTLNVNGGTLEWANNNSPMFTNVSFAFREAVNITTYDEKMKEAMRALQNINAEIRGEMMMDEWYKNNPDPFAANGNVTNFQHTPPTGSQEGEMRTLGQSFTPSAPMADQGRVVEFRPPTDPGTFIA